MRVLILIAFCALTITCNFFGKSTVGSGKLITEESVELNKVHSSFEVYDYSVHPFKD